MPVKGFYFYMQDVYLIILVLLFILAITDLVVGVSNDAINFLNSAVGSKAVSLRSILIIASLGVAVGAIFSSGLMEVARKGIFLPQEFYFEEIMIIFLAVMLTDVLLLDFFNSMGLPTSTTVSIMFELLGAAVSISLIKIFNTTNDISHLANFINVEKASEVIFGILLAIGIAFIAGAVVQYFSRLVLSFKYEKRLKYTGAIFGGVSLAAIFYFILINGLKSMAFVSNHFVENVNDNRIQIIIFSLLGFTILSKVLISFFKVNILKIIVIVGTFALALAFAGNDLVNFIGVPIAAWQSYEIWSASGVAASELLMSDLAGSVPTPEIILIFAGGVMVLTIWFSGKAQAVVDTGVKLSRQNEGSERFGATYLSRTIVRYSIIFGAAVSDVIPKNFRKKINSQFETPNTKTSGREIAPPAFDLVRASVNLVVASILISMGTNLQLPLSTTYVTFMVAMGTSLADRAWNQESAVYRVAGVLNVIGGWFVTAFVAFLGAAVFAAIIYFGGLIAIAILVCITAFFIVRNTLSHAKKAKAGKRQKRYKRTDIITINEITVESSVNISQVISGIRKRYTKTVDNLGYHDLGKLKKNNKKVGELEKEIDDLKGNIYYFIKSLDEDSVAASRFYIHLLDYLQEMVNSTRYITRNSFEHVNNNHKNLKFNQIRDLKKIDKKLQELFEEIKYTFDEHDFERLDDILAEKQQLLDMVSEMIEKQIKRIRTSESSPKNTKLYFGLLLESKDLISSTLNLIQLFREFYVEAKTTL
ncbi:Phosphate transporter family protein [Salegentibacter salegens]|uniref:Phosphate transporter n=2 Tax=Salegentibacter salegens TaxID=143223 RepID=A0A1M7MXT2_9FLAO|nr:phosphate transporter family protein [Salegentibacter salegens]SHM95983.1 Phosphate transporter family protein [Salegentibacter salegens]